MKTFRLKAYATFEADSIDDAFDVLAQYFAALAGGESPPMLITSGEIEIKCVIPNDPH